MADVTYRGNLKSAGFPFLSELFGRTVIVKGQDQNFVAGLAAKESLDSSAGVPQIYYCHNVVPTDNGYKSVGYSEYTPDTFGATAQLGSPLTLRDGEGNSALLAVTAGGELYVMQRGTSTWVVPLGAPTAATIAGRRITVAFVAGVTYIYIYKYACYTYDWGTNTLTLVALGGLTASDVVGIVGHRGYLLAYTESTAAWSSVLDATDFVPSLETGAGGGQIEGIRGRIVTAEEVYGGIIFFAEENCVAAVASDNPRYPYSFSPITSSGGLTDASYVSQDASSGSIYAYTTAGLQLINLRQAVSVFPEVTDFLSGAKFEDFDETTNQLLVTQTGSNLILKRLVLVLSRYLIISYGNSSLTHALYYDTAYKQWGRLKVDHTDCFELALYESGTVETPKKSIAFLGATGSIKVLDSDIVSSVSSGVMLLGKFQYVRSRFLTLEGCEFENVNSNDTFSLYTLPSLDGKNFEAAVGGYLAHKAGQFRRYSFHNTALNHTLLAKGAFNAVSFLLTFTAGGDR